MSLISLNLYIILYIDVLSNLLIFEIWNKLNSKIKQIILIIINTQHIAIYLYYSNI